MLGNVREWCHDWYGDYGGDVTDPWGTDTGSIRVLRGGSWVLGADMARAAKRQSNPPDHPSHDTGFRLARTLP
jgi:formylglycine-generating enzyme required for sulfatase activity